MKPDKYIYKHKGMLPLVVLVLGLLVELEYMHWHVYGYGGSLQHLFLMGFDACILTLVYSLFPVHKARWIAIPLIFLCIYTLGNVLFSRHIVGYMPWSAWMQYENLHGLGDSILYGMRWPDVFLMLFVLLLSVWGVLYQGECSRLGTRVLCLSALSLFFLAIPLGASYIWRYPFIPKKGSFEYETNPRKVKYKCGILLTTYSELVYANSVHRVLNKEERERIENYISRPAFVRHFTHLPRRIIFVMLESLISDPIDKVIDGTEVTPTLNRLKKDGFYCGNMLSEVQKGASSDGQFIYFTGLLPERDGITIADFLDNEFPGLGLVAQERGYETIIINPSNKSSWQQNRACQKYGIRKHFSTEDFEKIMNQKHDFRNWLNDEQVFDYAYTILQQHKAQPVFMTILTISTHMPYNKKFDKSIREFPSVTDAEYSCYLQMLHYADWHLGKFLDKLATAQMMDDMLLVVAADHSAPATFGTEERHAIPLILWGGRHFA